MIRVAAVGDVHLGRDSDDALERSWAALSDEADVLLLAGDLTKCGTVDEALVVAEHLRRVTVPVVAVLGNHDHHDGRPEQVVDVLRAVGVHVLDGTTVTLDIDGARLGIAGIKGFGGGFAGANASAFGEAEMKAFVHHAEEAAARLGDALAELDRHDCAARLALTHYSPVRDTLAGEPTEIYPFLGSQLLAEAIDAHRVDLALHGHAHAGVENGETAGGVPVRNVAMPVIRSAYRVFVVGA